MAKRPGKKDRMRRLLALILCVLLAGSALIAALLWLVPGAYAEQAVANASSIELSIDEVARAAHVVQQTHYVNQTGSPITGVLFALHANVWRRGALSDAEIGTPGGVLFFRIEVNGTPADWAVRGDDESFLRVACALQPGESATFDFAYELLLPEAPGFFGASELGWRLSLCYPIPVRYDALTEEYAAVALADFGSCIYFDRQDYAVTIDAPERWRIACGGLAEAAETADGRTVTTIRLQDARDFAVALSRMYGSHRAEAACGAVIEAFTNTDAGARRAAEAAASMADWMAALTGDCPFDRFTLAQTDAGGGCADHTGLAFLDAELFGWRDGDELALACAYQTAKQWFGHAVLSNPALEPWLSDSLCRYLALLWVRDTYGAAKYVAAMDDNSLDALRITLPGTLGVDSAASQFLTETEYETVIYGRGAAALYGIGSLIGEDTLRRAISLYYQKEKGQTASIADFADALHEASGRALDALLMEALRDPVALVGEEPDWGMD